MNRTKNAYDKWSVTYDTDKNPHTALEEKSVVDLVAPERGDCILDAGCGTGRYCALFQAMGATVVGLDFSDSMLAIARKKLPETEFVQADMTGKLPFPDGAFTKINCAQTMKHIPDLAFTLGEFARLIQSGGTITFSVTHPDMNWEGYEKEGAPSSCILTEEADIFHYRFCDYFEAFALAGLRLSHFCQVPVDETIREYLTADSYEMVKGRYQIAIFQLTGDTSPQVD